MEDANFLEEDDSHATTFALADFPAKAFEQGFYVLPSDVRAGRVGEDCFKGASVRTLHTLHGTKLRYLSHGACFRGLTIELSGRQRLEPGGRKIYLGARWGPSRWRSL